MTTSNRLIPSAEPELLVDGGATEGPLWHSEGYLTFVRHRESRLMRWDPDGTHRIVREDTGSGNGCTLGLDGDVWMCEGGARRVTRMRADGTVTVAADKFRGRRLNAPNDIVCRSDGVMYFTDPQARLPIEDRELGFSGVFMVTADSTLELATDECEYPNGLAFSPDETLLYVAITRRDEQCYDEVARGEICRHRFIRVFDVRADGTLGGNRLFADMTSEDKVAPDGLKVDTDGNVYATGPGGVWVFDSAGDKLGVISVPGVPPRNLAFDGMEPSTLYVTAGDGVYRIPTLVTGITGAARTAG
ncbi:hypothetical protein CH267_13025 [Rhodococcus sp. 06-621-2]|nr:SMP-30/gluconolactonase/LRE family protein [Rhodococcus sp. 06-621-2]OZC55494.1 hypothetical protein CH267_13025 [Rhodococcus sp. 06-621-2]